MNVENTNIDDLIVLNYKVQLDTRGSFFKIFNNSAFMKSGIDFSFREIYFSQSKKDVIRGMHFQLPPYEHCKLVWVIQGEIKDVILDLRKESKTFRKFVEIHLNAESGKLLYIPKGLAHGFISLSDKTVVGYCVSSEYEPKYDFGIKYDSFGYNWKISSPIISERDLKLIDLEDFTSPF